MNWLEISVKAIVPLSRIPPVGLCCQNQASQAGITNILHSSVFCEMQSPIPAGDKRLRQQSPRQQSPDDLALGGISSGWLMAHAGCHPDDITAFERVISLCKSSGWDIRFQVFYTSLWPFSASVLILIIFWVLMIFYCRCEARIEIEVVPHLDRAI